MTTLVETIMKNSRVAAFVFDRLANKTYPKCLFWIDQDDYIFCLVCTHRKKEGWSQETQNIFMDYNNFKVRKSVAGDKDSRSVFLQALKSSPYVEIIKEKSTFDKKVCKFTERFKELIDSLMEDFTLPVQLDENITASNVMPFEVIPQAEGCYAETFMHLGSTPATDNAEATIGFHDSLCLSNGESTFVPSILQEPPQTPMEMESAVPCISLPETDNNNSSLYTPYNESIFLSENQRSADDTNGEGYYAHLVDTQLSPNILVNEEYPPDYDPVKDLILSREPPPDPAGNQLDLRQETQSQACEILSIHGLEIVGNRVHVLDQVEMNALKLGSSKYYMVNIKDVTKRQ